MSLILDALRKSEAERRRGQAPSLYAQAPVPSASLRPAWMPWLPVAGGVLLLVGAAVWFMRDSDAPVTKDELVQQGPSLVSTPAATPGAAPSVVIVPQPAPPPPSPAPAAHATAPTVDALVKPPTNPAAAAANAATSHSPQASVADTPDTAANDAAQAAPVEDAVPSVAVLDPSTRGSLPPMKLSMHVYDPDPTRRFAIIDGQRVTEGAQLGSAIVLEIRRDGVLLDVSGRRVLLPRP